MGFQSLLHKVSEMIIFVAYAILITLFALIVVPMAIFTILWNDKVHNKR